MKRLPKPADKKNYHWHHIVPKHAGGTDDAFNLILLHPREHIMWHIARAYYYRSPKDLNAAALLKSHLGYDDIIIDRSGSNNIWYGVPMSEERKAKMRKTREERGLNKPENHWNYGNTTPKTVCDKISAGVLAADVPNPQKGLTKEEYFGAERAADIKRKCSINRIGKTAGKNNPMYGRSETITCPVCGKTGGRMMLRWHGRNGERCRHNNTNQTK